MGAFRDLWINENVQFLRSLYPQDDVNEVTEFVSCLFDERFKDPKCILYNNYEKERIETTLSKFYDWQDAKKPILTESGSIFKQHSQCWNPDTQILDGLLRDRKVAKKAMFNYKEKSKEAVDNIQKMELLEISARYNLKQKRLKVIANSEYGVSGLSTSAQFNMACASATTARGQALISAATTAFEDFLADNVLFMNMDECIRFIYDIIGERESRKLKDSKWVRNKSIQDVAERLAHKFIESDIVDNSLIMKMLARLDQEDLNRIYYKSNMEEFFRNSHRASNLLRVIVSSHKTFLDPANPPKDFAKELSTLKEAVLEYVHYNHPTTDRVYRLKTHFRKRVIVIDTDSNFLNLGAWYDFVMDEIMGDYANIGKSRNGYTHIGARDYNISYQHEVQQQRIFRIVNSMIHIITDMIANVLDEFMVRCNLADMSRNKANMKNEFLYDTILITDAKKHYQGAVRLQEGHLNKVPELDIKGKLCPTIWRHIVAKLFNCWEKGS